MSDGSQDTLLFTVFQRVIKMHVLLVVINLGVYNRKNGYEAESRLCPSLLR